MFLLRTLASDYSGDALKQAWLLFDNIRPLLFPTAQLLFAQLADGMSEAEANYTRRLNAATVQGRPIAEVEETQARKVAKEINKRIQVSAARDLWSFYRF